MRMLSYLKKNQDDFKTTPRNVVDALLICWLAYFDFATVKDQLPLKLNDFEYIPEYKKLAPYESSFFPRFSRKFMHLLAISPRFKDVKLIDCEYILDKKQAAQFAVVAIKIEKEIIIAIRGTDPSYAGWKEDFTMSYKDSIHSYAYAEEFVKRVIKKHKEKIILCGHSKGGNICTHVLSHIDDDSQIEKVYSFDGPGFRNDGLFKDKEERLNKFTKIVPQSSVVGVLFNNETDIKIIKSRSVTLLQHNIFEWVIKNNDFVYVQKRTLSSRYLEKSVNSWIEALDPKDRERFTEIIFGELDKFDAEDVSVFFRRIMFQIKPAWKAYRSLDKKDKKVLHRVILRLIRNLIKPEKKKTVA